MSKQKNTRPTVVDEDVDDLDDVLEQFTPAPSKQADKGKASSSATPSKTSQTATSSSVPPQNPPIGLEDLNLNDDFARELAEGMASLLRKIGADASTGSGVDSGGDHVPQTEEELEREKVFRQTWEEMLSETMKDALNLDDNEVAASSTSAPKAKEKTAAPAPAPSEMKEDAFQANIRKAMEKLKESETKMQAESGAGSNDLFEEMMKGLGEGGESEEELTGILESMMTQLMSKDVLYEPLKELGEKFPAYLAENESTMKPEDKKRYLSQQTVVTKIVSIFESVKYSDEDPEQGAQVVALMNEMQSFGSPPPEIMGPLPPGLDVGPDGLPKLPDSCTIA
ncbi:Pex19 protein [Abortiporus biennis]